MKLGGIFTIKSYTKDGKLFNISKEKNLVVNDGFYSLMLFINGGGVGSYSDISIGTGTSTYGVSESDTSLFFWYADETADVDWEYPNKAKWSAIFSFAETVTPTEIAITKQSHGILFNHLLISSPITYHTGEYMTVEYELEVNNE